MASGKEIKARIKSIKNTGKITKAMELISTVKMKKAQESVVSLRPFALAALSILSRISHTEDVLGIYGKADPAATRELIILVAAQKGLCGGYNVNVFKKATEYIRDDVDTPYTREYDYITIGKRSRDFILRTGQSLLADFSDEIRDPITVAESRRMVRFAISEWQTGKYSKVSIIYNHYVSAITQLPIVKPLFPIDRTEIESFLHNAVGTTPSENRDITYTIEPDATTIVEYTIPMILDAMIHETLLEARASEHAARMIAMKNAKDSANKKWASLTLIYNKARQWAITKEVSEIVSGVESMKE
jgi:F-type H+-transporting ATPase subunit gamma